MNPQSHHRYRLLVRKLQQGMNLIEMMVATLIALFIATALLFVFVGMRASSVAQSQLAQLQNDERVVIAMLVNTIQQAGYYVDPLTQSTNTVFTADSTTWADAATSDFAVGQYVVGIGNGSGSGAASDRVSVRFQSNNADAIINCNGTTLPNPPPILYVNNFMLDAQNELTCSVNGAPPVVIANNVFAMHIVYGTDTQNHNNVDTYLSADAVTQAGLWNNVRTLQLRVQFLDPTRSTATNPVPMAQSVLQFISLKNLQ